MNKKHFVLAAFFILIIFLAFFLRLYHLDERVFHHDESAVGYFTYKLFNDSVYSYDPSFHGPFMYYATSEMYRHLEDTVFASRLLPALIGASMIFLLIPLRRYLGNTGTVIAAFFLALSPSFLYYSRFYREDIFISFFTLLALVCAVKYAEAFDKDRGKVSLLNLHFFAGYSIERVFYLALGGIAISSMAALKENAYIIMALIALFLFLFFIREGWYRGLIDRLKRPDREFIVPILEGLFLVLVVLVVFSLFYTGNLLDISGMKAAVEKALSHWYEMHRIERMGGPYFFYIARIALYELPVLVFGILGMFYYGCRDRKKEKLLAVLLIYWVFVDIMYLIAQSFPWTGKFLPITYIQSSILIFLPILVLGMIGVVYIKNRFIAFLVFWALSNFFIYSYVQEKVPWLVLNPLLPLVLIAAAYLGEVLPGLNIRSRAGAAAVFFLLVSSLFFVHSSLLLNYQNYTDPAEPMIQASQAPQKFSEVITKISEISSGYSNQSTEIQITDVNLETQFLWHGRHYSNIKWKVSLDAEFNAPLIVVHDSDGNETEADVMQRNLGSDYIRLDSAKMSWYWFKMSDITPEYVLWRKMNRPPDEYRFVLFYKPVTK
ncbi:MAG: TIGR03663 family protein [Euryarchaeota archaeon]|nr:TIGR03663 family protein [Euryarchaeota archaeon]MBU4340752.1 TIGR03663 family protein [Euryarchaeota archaeon]MBU4454404.1 TIGR03663 family protein [Euryarchaeota archaeon]MCG2736517.1 TIGR03663 family protein [Candidatus Methanoperedenaceae archaeon]